MTTQELDKRILKKRTPHGMKRVPVSLGMVGLVATFQANGHDYEVNYGESFYQSSREMFAEANFMLSVLAELSKRSIKQPLVLESRDGSFTLDGDLRESGAEVSTNTSNEEKIVPLELMGMMKDSAVFMGVVSSMMQRGTFSYTQFGELQFQLSGFAITQLRQGVEAPITPDLKAMTIALKEILDILSDAYAGGKFDTMTLSGRLQDPQRAYFSEQISPEMLRERGTLEIELLPQLPQDDVGRAALAQMLRESPNGQPLADDRFIREGIMKFQDVEQIERAIFEQLAQTGSPTALAFSSMMAAAEQGNEELATIWSTRLQIAMMTDFLEMMQLQIMGGQPGGGAGAGGSNGQGSQPKPRLPNSSALPPQSLGINAQPIQQAGSIVPAGTPRPGARFGEAGFRPF